MAPIPRLFLAIGVLTPLLTTAASGQSPLENLFQAGKREFKLASYEASLNTFQKLDEMSQQPGFEAARVKLEPLIAFYRGANYAALGQKETAEKQFEIYLISFPGAHLDPAFFPRPVIACFDHAKQASAKTRRAVEKRASGVAADVLEDYARFKAPTGPDSERADEKWGSGPVRFLMTKAEREEWPRLDSSQRRAEFVTKFWQRRDPTPETPQNEWRDEVERRIAYADARFTADEKRGSETDRGMVFIMLGPPSYISETPFTSDDDPVQVARAAPIAEYTRDADGTTNVHYEPRAGLTAQKIQGTKETWHYRRDRLPKFVRFTEVDFEFVTRKGLGVAVLQRDPEILTTLDQVAARNGLPGRD